MTKLLGLDYETRFKKGTENRVADALSREYEDDTVNKGIVDHSKLLAISMVVPTWMQEIYNSYEGDTEVADQITQRSTNIQGPSLFHYST